MMVKTHFISKFHFSYSDHEAIASELEIEESSKEIPETHFETDVQELLDQVISVCNKDLATSKTNQLIWISILAAMLGVVLCCDLSGYPIFTFLFGVLWMYIFVTAIVFYQERPNGIKQALQNIQFIKSNKI